MSQGFGHSVVPDAPRRLVFDAATLGERLKACFASLDDPRVERGQLHQLTDIVVIAILSVIAGVRGWEDMEFYGSTKQAWLSTFLLVSAWASGHRLVLAQPKVQDKSNEITAIPALLELLDLVGCIVTLDAMGTQKSIAAQIQAAKADYILSLKANHPTLFTQVQTWFETARQANQLPPSSEYKIESHHHRLESRQV